MNNVPTRAQFTRATDDADQDVNILSAAKKRVRFEDNNLREISYNFGKYTAE